MRASHDRAAKRLPLAHNRVHNYNRARESNMPSISRLAAPLAGAALAAALTLPRPAAADVTVQEQASFDLAIFKMHITSSEETSTDKQRRDSEARCEGFMSLLCGDQQSGEIVRVDRALTWTLDPPKKQYRETPFPTPEQQAAARQHAQEMLAKMQQCPAAKQSGPDTSKCEMTPPVVDVKATDNHASVAGHDSKLTEVSLTQSCRNKDTGDECNIVLYLDTWLTQDQIPGLEERKAFRQAYLQKIGRGDGNELMQKQVRQLLAKYADSLKQLEAKSADLKGYPLKTTVRIAYGGEHCGSAKQGSAAGSGATPPADTGQTAAADAASSAASSAAAGNSKSSMLSSAASSLGSKFAGSLFKKKTPAADAGAAGAAGAAAPLPPGMVQAASMTFETTSIAQGAVAAERFEVPAGWKQVVPQPQATKDEFRCPGAGS
jgi:hypothetical protein